MVWNYHFSTMTHQTLLLGLPKAVCMHAHWTFHRTSLRQAWALNVPYHSLQSWDQIIPQQDDSQCNVKILEVSECFVFDNHDPIPFSVFQFPYTAESSYKETLMALEVFLIHKMPQMTWLSYRIVLDPHCKEIYDSKEIVRNRKDSGINNPKTQDIYI